MLHVSKHKNIGQLCRSTPVLRSMPFEIPTKLFRDTFGKNAHIGENSKTNSQIQRETTKKGRHERRMYIDSRRNTHDIRGPNGSVLCDENTNVPSEPPKYYNVTRPIGRLERILIRKRAARLSLGQRSKEIRSNGHTLLSNCESPCSGNGCCGSSTIQKQTTAINNKFLVEIEHKFGHMRHITAKIYLYSYAS